MAILVRWGVVALLFAGLSRPSALQRVRYVVYHHPRTGWQATYELQCAQCRECTGLGCVVDFLLCGAPSRWLAGCLMRVCLLSMWSCRRRLKP